MLLDSMKFTKSLKFKLTVWYSALLSLFCVIFVIAINIWLSNYMQSNVIISGQGFWGRAIESRPMLRNLTEDQIEIIMESRLTDLNNIRNITLYSIIPLVILSFFGGYIIADIILKPLDKLNKEIKNKEAENLNKEIEFEDNGDEISELIKSFNRMSRRLGKSFDSQTEFVENASHELKTPLAIIQANLDTALDDDSISKKELQEILHSSKDSIQYMNKLTEDLLLLSILEESIEMEDVNVTDVINSSIKELKSIYKDNKVIIKKNVGKERLDVKGNTVLLHRSIMNILENAVKYSECEKIEITTRRGKDFVKISIKDDGKGIPKNDLKRIFDRFYRVDKSRSKKTGGSGLGLSISKRIIETFGGSISVNSKVSIGTEFIIQIPLN